MPNTKKGRDNNSASSRKVTSTTNAKAGGKAPTAKAHNEGPKNGGNKGSNK